MKVIMVFCFHLNPFVFICFYLCAILSRTMCLLVFHKTMPLISSPCDDLLARQWNKNVNCLPLRRTIPIGCVFRFCKWFNGIRGARKKKMSTLSAQMSTIRVQHTHTPKQKQKLEKLLITQWNYSFVIVDKWFVRRIINYETVGFQLTLELSIDFEFSKQFIALFSALISNSLLPLRYTALRVKSMRWKKKDKIARPQGKYSQ